MLAKLWRGEVKGVLRRAERVEEKVVPRGVIAPIPVTTTLRPAIFTLGGSRFFGWRQGGGTGQGNRQTLINQPRKTTTKKLPAAGVVTSHPMRGEQLERGIGETPAKS
jgi:hypothetical protein